MLEVLGFRRVCREALSSLPRSEVVQAHLRGAPGGGTGLPLDFRQFSPTTGPTERRRDGLVRTARSVVPACALGELGRGPAHPLLAEEILAEVRWFSRSSALGPVRPGCNTSLRVCRDLPQIAALSPRRLLPSGRLRAAERYGHALRRLRLSRKGWYCDLAPSEHLTGS